MFATTRHILRKVAAPRASASTAWRFKSSTIPEEDSHVYAFDEDGEIAEFVDFSGSGKAANQREQKPILLTAREHAVGYLSKILNARVYEAAIETELQEAKNLSTVRAYAYAFLSAPLHFFACLSYPSNATIFFCFLDLSSI